jgi:GT2 family glycosyltransferase
MTLVTVIIPNYNGRKYLEECLNTLKLQEEVETEVIIIDNGSTDDSVSFIKDKYPEHLLIENQENQGFSQAVNQGIKASDTEYVFLLNNDTALEPDCIRNLLDCIRRDEYIFAVSSRMVRYKERDKMDDAGDEYTVLGWTYKVGDGQSTSRYKEIRDVFSACAGAALYRRDILHKLGLFDEKFFAYLEDVDISYRARINGYRSIYCPRAVVYHHTSSTTGSRYNEWKIKLSARNNIYLAYKNMPWPQLLVNSPFLLLGFLIKYLFFIKRGQGKHYWEGLVEGLRTLHKVEKTAYRSENRGHYFKIEYQLLRNIFKFP